MTRIALVLLILAGGLRSTGAGGELVQFRLKNNDRITGELLSPERKGYYRIRVDGDIVELRHDEVYTTEPVGADDSDPSVVFHGEEGSLSFLNQMIEELDLRKAIGISPDSQRIYRNALAAVARNEWDHAIRGGELLLEREPLWADPQILRAVLHSERGETRRAMEAALRLEALFPKDLLALRAAAKCYGRAGFPHRRATVLGRVFDTEFGGDRALYERIALWWPVDPTRAMALFHEYEKVDPMLGRPWCRENALLRSVELALGIQDWSGAQAAVDELRRRFPWASKRVLPTQVKILEARLEDAYRNGRQEESMVALATLTELEPERAQEWAMRRDGLERHFLERVALMRSFEDLKRWCAERGHLFADDDATRTVVANQYQRLALGAIREGNHVIAQQSWLEAMRWDESARPEDLEKRIDSIYERVAEDLKLGRHQRRLATIEALRGAYPERRETFLRDLTSIYEDALADRASPAELRHQLDELRALFLRQAPASAVANREPRPAEAEMRPAADELRLASTAFPLLSRYFPHEIGSKWVYQRGDGEREVREVVGVTPLENGGWKIQMRVTEGKGDIVYPTQAFLLGGDLILGHPEAPPGEIALRYPLSPDFGWDWSKASLRFERKVERPSDPLSLSFGAFDDYLVVHGVNTISTPGSDKEYSTWTRITYVAGIGVVRVEAQDPKLERTLLEYIPPIKSAQR